ncbi:MAG: sigma-54-dependent transcriptional regulator [Acidiferrobacteraceae bacterium]
MSKNQVLIVDDESDIRELLELTLGRMNLETRSAENLETAYQLLDQFAFDLCLTDMRLPDGSGLDIVRHIQEKHPLLPVAVITAHGSMETAIAGLKAGAFDFVSKPVDLNELRNLVRTALKVAKTAGTGGDGTSAARLLGISEPMVRIRVLIERLARGQAPVYISGESGTGKELAAQLIHELGPRASHPFVPVNCGAIPEQLMESEFFGHKKGSFTGASQDKDGLFRAADGGTLFLDEVGDLPLAMQVKLLRAIQEKSVRPVGAQIEAPVDVRVLSATHRDLHALVADGSFRQDLYYRLNVIELRIPPLRERRDDIPLLAEHLSAKLTHGLESRPQLSKAAMEILQDYDFPGNVRELENILERALTLCDGSEMGPEDLQLRRASDRTAHARRYGDPKQEDVEPATETAQATKPAGDDPEPVKPYDGREPLDGYLARIERRAIEQALARADQNKTAAAKLLGITFRALRYKLEKLGIE